MLDLDKARSEGEISAGQAAQRSAQYNSHEAVKLNVHTGDVGGGGIFADGAQTQTDIL